MGGSFGASGVGLAIAAFLGALFVGYLVLAFTELGERYLARRRPPEPDTPVRMPRRLTNAEVAQRLREHSQT